MKKPRITLPRTPPDQFAGSSLKQWQPGAFAHHPPAEASAGLRLERPHEHVPSGRGARNLKEHVGS